jgi:lysophospholipase L1-like esterase
MFEGFRAIRRSAVATSQWGMLKVRSVLVTGAAVAVAAAVSIAAALWVTPMQRVSAAGQTVQVGVAPPSWSLSGPGELDLFGQRIPTAIQFSGPVRPRLQLTRITMSRQLADFAGTGAGGDPARALQHALVQGWEHFFVWQVVVVAAVCLALLGAVAGWQRRSRRQTLLLLGVGLAVAQAVNLGAIMTTAYTAPQKLRQVTSLQALVGGAPDVPVAPASAPPPPSGAPAVVVLGDSTAAGLGNPPLPNADAQDSACRRSIDAYAVDLANANNWQVTNLACSGATIQAGLLGPQQAGSQTLPPQLASPAVAKATTVVVSIGANDVTWSSLLRVCAASPTCQDQAEEAYFQQQLAGFSQDYLRLLTELKQLPNHPNVIINLYYDPFTGDDGCLAPLVTNAKREALTAKLTALNTILANGAKTAAFATAAPNFTDHGLCSDQPYVQGLSAAAPFHPTPGGELAIALADEQALHPAANQR